VSLASSVLIGGAVALVLVVFVEYVWTRVFRAIAVRRFPELRGQRWQYQGCLLRYGRRRPLRSR
jgi:hypothetical protein